MLDNIFTYDAMHEILLKTLLVSIPEELFLVMFTLILVGEFDYWKEAECRKLINRFDYVRVFVPAVTTALLSQTMRYLDLNFGIYQFIPLIVLYILIVFTNDIFGDASVLKWMVKALMFLLVALLIIGITEFIYIPYLLYTVNQTVDEINKNIPLYCLISLPARLLQYSLLFYLISRKRTLLKGKLLKPILSNPMLAVISSISVVINILFLQVMVQAIAYDKVLVNFLPISKICIILGVVLFPMVNISGLLWGFYLLKDKETYEKKIASEQLKDLLVKIELHIKDVKYDNIRWKLNEIGMDVDKVANSLYRENGIDHHR